jgi:hypothetical protein
MVLQLLFFSFTVAVQTPLPWALYRPAKEAGSTQPEAALF